MLRRVVVLGLVFALISTVAVITAFQKPPQDVQAQANPPVIERLCLDRFTGYYKVVRSPNCPPYHTAIAIPDDYPVSLCASAFTLYLTAPLYNGECRPYTAVRIDLPSDEVPNLCLVPTTGRLRLAAPVPDGNCTGGSYAVVFPETERRYETFGNVDIDVPAVAGLLPNQSSGTTVTAFDATSAEGGTVVVDPDGAFRYIPPAGFTGEDSFTYTVTNGAPTQGTAYIDVMGPTVWFVDADAGNPGDGRRETPFDDLQVLNDDVVDPDEPGDFIFLYEAVSKYDDGLQLEENQALVGQEIDLAEILSMKLAEAPELQGRPAETLPPYIVLPEVDATPGAPILSGGFDPALTMLEGSMAAGLTMESDDEATVFAQYAGDLLLHMVSVQGANPIDEFDGGVGVVLEGAQMTITSSDISGGNGGDDDFSTASDGGPGVMVIAEFMGDTSGSSLQGGGAPDPEPQLTVIDSTINGGNGGDGSDGGDGGAGIESRFALMSITDSTINGGNGGEGIDGWGGDGGSGIANGLLNDLSFESSERTLLGEMEESLEYLTVTDSTITGGAGGTGFQDGGYGGDGLDTGLFGPLVAGSESGSSLQGVTSATLIARVTGSTVTGGPGGSALGELSAASTLQGAGSISYGGSGGSGILAIFFSIFDLSAESELQGPAPPFELAFDLIVSDSTLTGGAGGVGGSEGGSGGLGLLSSGVNATVDQGSVVTGGAGGLSPTNESGGGAPGILSGFFVFFLGMSETEQFGALADELFPQGRALQGPGLPPFDMPPGALTVDGSMVTGGVTPGTTFDSADVFSGDGIVAFGAPYFDGVSSLQGSVGSEEFDPIPVTITNSLVSGAQGADVPGGTGVWGGVGVVAIGADLTVDGNSQINGGDGGDGLVGGDGGEGIVAETSETLVLASTVTGGAAGATSGNDDGSFGGVGILAADCEVCATLEVSASVVTGGAGGAVATGNAGLGGPGIAADNESVVITTSTVTAGAPGAGLNTEGTAAVDLYVDGGSVITAEITDNTLIGSLGDSGQAPSLSVSADSATICVHATGNTPTGAFELDNNAGTLGITQSDTAALSSANNGVTVQVLTTITYNCSLTPEP